jgi:hypothetical protein
MPQQEGFSSGNNALLREPLPVSPCHGSIPPLFYHHHMERSNCVIVTWNQ